MREIRGDDNWYRGIRVVELIRTESYSLQGIGRCVEVDSRR